MNPLEAELAELRGRVSRLEAQLAALSGPAEEPAPTRSPGPVVSATSGAKASEAPPVIPPARSMPPRPVKPPLGDKLREVPSTVWIAGAGAVIFLIGAIYGLTVSIERGWISPAVRVGAGLLTGVAAGAVAMRLLFAGRRELGVTLLAVGVGTWTFALYFGAKAADPQLIPLGLGFAGAAVATLFAGALAARIRSDGAMAVALATGLAAPLAFASGTGTLPGLLAYFVALSAAQLAAHYATGAGGDWKISRALGLAGIWLVALAASPAARLGELAWAIAGVGLLVAAGLTLAWLPRHAEKPVAPAAGAIVVLLAAAFTLWIVWNRAHWERELYALVPLAGAAVSLGLMAGARTRGTRKHDQPLGLLAAGFGLVAVPIAIEWRWVTVAWGLGALLLALAARRQSALEEGGARQLIAGIVAVAASAVWLVQAFWQSRSDVMFLNPVFAGGALAAGAWAVLMTTNGQPRGLAFGAMQAVAVNALAWEFSRKIGSVSGEEATLPVGALLATLTYAAAGAAQWLRGVLYEVEEGRAKALRLAGYGWLVVAAIKLLGYDLDNRDLLFRAVAALGVGAVFIGAAFWADRSRARNEPPASS